MPCIVSKCDVIISSEMQLQIETQECGMTMLMQCDKFLSC